MCWPRRASFSVRMERRSSRTVTPSAATEPQRSAGSALRSCVSSSRKNMPVSGERMVPPIIAAMPIIAQRPVSPTGQPLAETAPSAPPMMSNGASTPPEVPGAERDRPDERFADDQTEQAPRREFRRAANHESVHSRRRARADRSSRRCRRRARRSPATTSSESAASQKRLRKNKPAR